MISLCMLDVGTGYKFIYYWIPAFAGMSFFSHKSMLLKKNQIE